MGRSIEKTQTLEPPSAPADREHLASDKWPTTLADASADVLALLSEKEKNELRKATKEDLIGYHFGLGMLIRNRHGLCRGNERLLRAASEAAGHPADHPCHPDDASSAIIEAAWKSLQLDASAPQMPDEQPPEPPFEIIDETSEHEGESFIFTGAPVPRENGQR